MKYNLAAMTARATNRRKRTILFRAITPPAMKASDLYAEVYAPVMDIWEATIPAIMAQYSTALLAMTRDSPEQISGTIGTAEAEASRVVLSTRLRLSQWTLRFEAWHRGKWRAAVKAATSIDPALLIGLGDVQMTLTAAIERNVSLVKSVSEQARQRISEAVFRGLNTNSTSAEVAKEIKSAVTMGRDRARRIASDQLVKINASLNQERRRDAGIDTWAWVSSHKLNYRPEHLARDGKRYSDKTAPQDLPGQLPFCGCTERAVLSLDGEF